MSNPRGRVEKLRRRAVSVPGLMIATIVLTVATPVWLPIAVLVDVVRMRLRFPIARLLAFAVCWCWIELLGVVKAFGLWARGRSRDQEAHYDLMASWSAALIKALGATTGIRPQIEGLDQVIDGNAIVLARHASLGDSLLSGWALTTEARLQPRYVLKNDLLYDPCLDIVGLRVPNHFLDRSATDSSAELAELSRLASGIGPGVVGVIFAEGTRANATKRKRAIDKIAERDPRRAERLAELRHLLPPRPAGSIALVDGAPGADIVLAWHIGFDGLDSFSGMIDRLAEPMTPARFVLRRVQRSEVPSGDGFPAWLDEQWLRMDAEVAAALAD